MKAIPLKSLDFIHPFPASITVFEERRVNLGATKRALLANPSLQARFGAHTKQPFVEIILND